MQGPQLGITKALDSARRAQLFALIMKRGEGEMVRALGVSRSTLARACAALPIYGGSRIAIETGLATIEDAEVKS